MKARILIVEDDPLIAMSLLILFKKNGFEVLNIIDNAIEALDYCIGKIPDLILLDVKLMGEKKGIWIGSQIKEKKLPIKIIYLTPLSDKETINSILSTSPEFYITKPYNTNVLISNIHLALQRGNANEMIEINDNRKKYIINTLDISVFNGYGITADSDLYFWGRDYYGYLKRLGLPRQAGSDLLHLRSPQLIDFAPFKNNIKKIVSEEYTYACLTNNNDLWMWGSQHSDMLNTGATGPQNNSNGLLTPIKVTLPPGENKIVDIEMGFYRFLFIGKSGNAYFRGRVYPALNSSGITAGKFGKPNGVKYKKILGTAEFHNTVYLKGNNNKYYAICGSESDNTNMSLGNTLAPVSIPAPDVRQSTSVYEINFPAGHGEIIKMGSRSNTFYAIDDLGQLYFWGEQSYSSASYPDYTLFKTSDANFTSVNDYKYYKTPVLADLPPGETGVKDVATYDVEKIIYIIGNSGKLYSIGQTDNIVLGIKDEPQDDNKYQYISSAGTDNKRILFTIQDALILKNSGEVFGVGDNHNAILGGFPNENTGSGPILIPRITPVPLLKGSLDSLNTNVQPVN